MEERGNKGMLFWLRLLMLMGFKRYCVLLGFCLRFFCCWRKLRIFFWLCIMLVFGIVRLMFWVCCMKVFFLCRVLMVLILNCIVFVFVFFLIIFFVRVLVIVLLILEVEI